MEPVGLDRLHQLSDRILTADLPDDAREELISEYSDAFGAFLDARSDQPHLGLEAETLEALLKNHEQIVACAESLKMKTKDAIGTLRKRGKAIMGYVDTLPRRVSTIGTRKL